MWNGRKVALYKLSKKSGLSFPSPTNGSIETSYLIKKASVESPADAQSYQNPMGFGKNVFEFIVWTSLYVIL